MTAVASTDYMPMFEIGKEWRYNLHSYSRYQPASQCKADTKVCLRVDGKETFNDRDYYVVNRYIYIDSETEPVCGGVFAYFHEDTEAKTISAFTIEPEWDQISDPELYYLTGHYGFFRTISDKEQKVFDFATYDGGALTPKTSKGKFIANTFTSECGVHNGYMTDDNPNWGGYEGIGVYV